MFSPATAQSPPSPAGSATSTLTLGDTFEEIFSTPLSTSELVKDAKQTIRHKGADTSIPHPRKRIKTGVKVDRFLLAMLEYAVGESAKRYAACTILATKHSDTNLEEVASLWLYNLIYPMKAAASKRTFTPSDSQTPTFEETTVLVERASRGGQAALKELLRRREGYHCAATGIRDFTHPFNANSPPEPMGPMEASHILPFSSNKIGNDKSDEAAVTWEMIKHWGSIDVQDIMGEGINDPSNAILLDRNSHFMFGAFGFWFENMETDNMYTIRVRPDLQLAFNDKVITFQNHSDKNIPLPKPQYLALHAALANVLHVSAAGEHFDAVWHDVEQMGVLSADGSSDTAMMFSMLSVCVF